MARRFREKSPAKISFKKNCARDCLVRVRVSAMINSMSTTKRWDGWWGGGQDGVETNLFEGSLHGVDLLDGAGHQAVDQPVDVTGNENVNQVENVNEETRREQKRKTGPSTSVSGRRSASSHSTRNSQANQKANDVHVRSLSLSLHPSGDQSVVKLNIIKIYPSKLGNNTVNTIKPSKTQ